MNVKKNFFQRTFNITVMLIRSGLFFLCLTIGLRLLQDLMTNAQSTYLSHLFETIKQWASKGDVYKRQALPSYLAMVDFDNLEACEVGYNVYFRANGIKEVK